MSELLPLAQAESIKHSLLDYLGTTFALADPDARRVLDDFLQHPHTGMFRGPYIRSRLPFRPAGEGWLETLEWYEGPTPYRHQAAAFARLSSYGRSDEDARPPPTLVTTGTGSGKTEAFLYPIIDHALRAKRAGQSGMKAIILYPMNALANDQALRLTHLLIENQALAGITAALYTGEGGPKRTKVTAEGLITDRDVIRDLAPDILLTNYKMLDQLLLRSADADMWRQSAHSLQYLVLDELHTYDGAQGTDVAMLLRRLGLTLKSYWSPDDADLTQADWERPLGRITPVATSATLGDGDDPLEMLDFAATIFGDEFGEDSIITESRLTIEEWISDAPSRLEGAGWRPAPIDLPVLKSIAATTAELSDPQSIAFTVLGVLYPTGDNALLTSAASADSGLMLDLVKSHKLFQDLIARSSTAAHLRDLSQGLMEADDNVRGTDESTRRDVASALINTLSHVRAMHGRAAVSVDVHLWIRELTRLDRAASGAPHFVWSDDGLIVDAVDAEHPAIPFYPAIYCRHCNRSGWDVALAPTGCDLDADDSNIRRRAMRRDDRVRALIHAPAEAAEAEAADTDERDDSPSGLAWFLVAERRISHQRPTEGIIAEGGALPVLVHRSDAAGAESAQEMCPSCRQSDGIRFLGSAIATLLSVSLSTLFGSPELDSREKRALVFTDSVQDAAHRAGFIQARSHTLTLRTLLRQALHDGETDLDALAHRVIERAGDDRGARYRILPPELAERDTFDDFWTRASLRAVPAKVRNYVRRRLLLDIELEFGLRSGVGRTLERTGTALAYINVSEHLLKTCAREALESADVQLTTDELNDARLIAWVRGALERMRSRGAIEHEWFAKFRREDGNRWWITGGRRRSEGMPGFGRGNSAPGYPVIGGSARDTDLEPVASARGWYAQWTAKALHVTPTEGAVLARLLFGRLRHRDVIGDVGSKSGAQTYHLPASSIVIRAVTDEELAAGSVSLTCAICRDVTHGSPEAIRQLLGAPCLVSRCDGALQPHRIEDNFYRQMYAATDIRRVVAREHTSLLPDDVRLEYESQFKQTDPPPNAPNVLVATPTLEMGIDIGDLSAVMLASLPRSVASYLQRVGRAGRLTGNALALAYVTARGDQLPRFARPEATINGAVRPPATYLDAEEILRRQFTASVADIIARRPDGPHPRSTPEALRSSAAKTFLGTLIAEAEARSTELVDRFIAGFAGLDDDVIDKLGNFPRAVDGVSGTSELATRCHGASAEWNRRIETLTHRKSGVEKVLPSLHDRVASPAKNSDDEDELRTAEATLRLINRQLASLRSEYWISALESFGLLPNYTLFDDSVTLSVSVHWINPESQQYEHSEFELRRGSAQALRDFAPGSTFYANGFAIEIDAIDLGANGEAVRVWAACARCGYVNELSEETGNEDSPSSCPRCQSATIADVSQRVPVVELSTVSAVIRREEATIDDASDERNRERYSIVTAADIDPMNITRRWFVQDVGFGAKHLRNLEVRWINLGRSGTGGSMKILAGDEIDAANFRVCSECGKLDTSTGRNQRREHRPWCSLRDALEESTTNIALSRKLITEGLVLRLPASITLGDSFAVPSLSAAILLGLREQIGGNPDHLEIATIIDPSLHGVDHAALLLHDVVPGGTGYLADLTDPGTVWDLLYRAWTVVKDCQCRDEGKLACERCLLPFATLPNIPRTSRSTAERHLANLLAGREFLPGEEVVVPELDALGGSRGRAHSCRKRIRLREALPR